MTEREKKERTTEEKAHYICDTCKERYELSKARQRELACCGQPLLKTEVIAKSTPEPFGP